MISPEYLRIIDAGEKNSLKALLESVGEKLPSDGNIALESSNTIPSGYELIVECKDETEQKSFFDKLKSEGYRIRVLNL